MSQEQRERERLRKLKEAQINARDPGTSKIKGYDWAKHAAKPLPKKRSALGEFWYTLPLRWKGAVRGMAFGAVLAIILVILLPGEWDFLALVPLLLCGIVGMILGLMFQEKNLY